MLENDDEMFMKTEVKEQGRSPSQKRTWDKNDKQRSDGRRGDQKKTKNEQFGRMEYPRCETCRKKHLGECYRKISASFKYGKEAHILRNYPNLGNATQKVKRDQLTQGCVYAVTVHDAAASPSTLVGTIPIFGHSAFILMDSGLTYCFVSHSFTCKLYLKSVNLDYEMCVATPSGEILCMDWLAAHHARVKCFKKEDVFQPEWEDEFKSEDLTIYDVQIINEFANVFPNELPKIPPKREVEFKIDLAPDTRRISKAPYQMPPSELKDLKEQLQDLLNK
nr:uncharacterized protein LOC112489480 [Ziziphus jujuba var. spinosa]